MNALGSLLSAESDWSAGWFRRVIARERDTLSAFLESPVAGVEDVIALLAAQDRPIVLTGIGKSGHVAAKLAATFSSLGIPALFLHAAEAAHGDLGSVVPGSCVLMFSNSGSTGELLRIAPVLKARDCVLVGVIGRSRAPLARLVDHLIDAEIEREADHTAMAPTASTVLQLAIGDALAVAVSAARGFTREDFLRHHPAGLLGRQMIPAASLMRQGEDLPVAAPGTALVDLLAIMSRGRMGAACVVGEDGRLVGLVVDGDVRRFLQSGRDLAHADAACLMQPEPHVIGPRATLGEIQLLLRERPDWLVLPVVDPHGDLLGMLHASDIAETGA